MPTVDMGASIQIVQTIVKTGLPLETANWVSSNGTQSINFFGIHFSPIRYLFAGAYWIFPNAITLLFVQALFVSLGSIPAYKLSLHVLRERRAALLVSGFYLLIPPIVMSNLSANSCTNHLPSREQALHRHQSPCRFRSLGTPGLCNQSSEHSKLRPPEDRVLARSLRAHRVPASTEQAGIDLGGSMVRRLRIRRKPELLSILLPVQLPDSPSSNHRDDIRSRKTPAHSDSNPKSGNASANDAPLQEAPSSSNRGFSTFHSVLPSSLPVPVPRATRCSILRTAVQQYTVGAALRHDTRQRHPACLRLHLRPRSQRNQQLPSALRE